MPVGWSYGGFIICDHVRAHGVDTTAEIALAFAAVMRNDAYDNIGPGFLKNTPDAPADDLPTIIAGMRRFVRAWTAKPLGDEDFETALCYNMVVPRQVRRAPVTRRIGSDDVLSNVSVPVLVTHGE